MSLQTFPRRLQNMTHPLRRTASLKPSATLRARVAHSVGSQTNEMSDTLERTIGFVRTKAKTGIKTLSSTRIGAIPRNDDTCVASLSLAFWQETRITSWPITSISR